MLPDFASYPSYVLGYVLSTCGTPFMLPDSASYSSNVLEYLLSTGTTVYLQMEGD